MQERQAALQRKNRQLELRKQQIEEQLNNLDNSQGAEYEQDPNYAHEFEWEEEKEAKEEAPPDQEEHPNDLISELEAVKKATEERNQSKIKELRKRFESNQNTLQKNQERIEKYKSNLEQAEAAVKIKTQLKRDLQGKGKKISDESKKWINQIAKLNDKHEDLKKQQATLAKDQQSLKCQLAGLEKRLAEHTKEKSSYEVQQKTLNGKLQQLKVETEGAKQLLKQKELQGKEQNLKNQKNRQKAQMNQKRLERQKGQLLKAYKKLGQYIALLRKTNTHLQTANSLNFSLKEYLQAVDKADVIS